MYCKRESISHSNVEIANMYFVNTFANKNRILYNRVPYAKLTATLYSPVFTFLQYFVMIIIFNMLYNIFQNTFQGHFLN